MRIRSTAVLAGLLTVTGLAACGTTTLDPDKAAGEISRAVRVQAGVPVKEVTCPENVKAAKGDTFSCTVIARDGTRGQVKVTQKDDQGNIRFNAPFIHMDEAENAMSEQIRAQIAGIKDLAVDCPDIVIGKAGAPFECKGTADGRPFTVTATQTDGSGRFTFKTRAD